MDPDAFARSLPGCYDPFWTADVPRDRRLRAVLDDVPGMATENKLMLLNHAVAGLAAGEVYLEIGCWRGCSLIGALHGNASAHAVAVDDFSQFAGSRDLLLAAIARHGLTDRVRFLEGDFGAVLSGGAVPPRSVGVYLFDGAHDYASQHRALVTVEPLLADRAVVVVDDAAWPAVRDANRAYTAHHPAWRLLFDIPSPVPGEPRWWNGLQVFAFERARGRPGRLANVRRWLAWLAGRFRHERVAGIRWGIPGRRRRAHQARPRALPPPRG